MQRVSKNNESPSVTVANSYRIATWVFIRLLGVTYFVAFLSLYIQLDGLVSSNGILPFHLYLEQVYKQLGSTAYRLLPTLLWFSQTDSALYYVCILGMVFSALLTFGIAPIVSKLGAWIFYLSLVHIGQEFLSFQWDSLLLEVGFLATFLLAPHLKPKPLPKVLPNQVVLFMLWWLLFRLMFRSGAVKLLSGDSSWHDLIALTFHYETQPLPTWIGYYVHQLPFWFHRLSVASMFVIELFIPFLIFTRYRRFAAIALIALQLLIALTGNYTYFNLLTVSLCILLFSDTDFSRLFKSFRSLEPIETIKRPFSLSRLPANLVMAFILVISSTQLVRTFFGPNIVPKFLQTAEGYVSPFRSINSYGLFAVMTTKRLEIFVQGSNDLGTWKDYDFKWKPQDLNQHPLWVAPHQPRLDWQMWFAALSNPQNNPWFYRFVGCLLRDQSPVLKLLKQNPFPEKPPRFIRAVLYEYHFTTLEEKRTTGNWWKRELNGVYMLPANVRDEAEKATLFKNHRES